MLRHYDWQVFKAYGMAFLIPKLFVLILMRWWSQRFTWTHFWTMVALWVILCAKFCVLRMAEENKHPALSMWIISEEEEATLIGGGGLTIRHGSDRPPSYVRVLSSTS